MKVSWACPPGQMVLPLKVPCGATCALSQRGRAQQSSQRTGRAKPLIERGLRVCFLRPLGAFARFSMKRTHDGLNKKKTWSGVALHVFGESMGKSKKKI